MEEINRQKNRQIKLMIVGLAILVIGLVGITYSFFNYTRTGVSNTIKVGRISFVTRELDMINLTNVFPISSSEATGENTNYDEVVIEIVGDTDYSGGIEYLVSAVDANIYTNQGQIVPISLDIKIDDDLGTENNNYFVVRKNTNTSIYKKIVGNTIVGNEMLLVGYIAPNSISGTREGIDATISIKAYLDKDKILISDTYPSGNVTHTESSGEASVEVVDYTNGTTSEWVNGRVVLTTSEWNSLQNSSLSFKVRVEANEGIWVEDPSAYNMLSKSADTVSLINFEEYSSSSNGEGLYRLPGTENDDYPIYYYRGAIDNNNVLFAGFCWQMIRTTETGGIKMIYNGLPDIEGSGDNISYNCGAARDIQDTIMTTQILSSSPGYYYADDYEIVSTLGNSVTYRLKAGPNGIHQIPISYSDDDASTKIPLIAENYPYTCLRTSADETCTTLYKVDSYLDSSNANVYSSKDRTIIGRSKYNTNNNSLSDIGYMSNETFPNTPGTPEGAIYGKDIEWDGTNYLVIEDTSGSPSSNTTRDNNHHYSCGTSGVTSCSTVRYYYYNYRYIQLSNGDLLEDAIYKMTGNGSQATKTKNSGYVLNQNDSIAKIAIETWFKNNLTNEVNQHDYNYSTYIEDTVYCSDRSFRTTGIYDKYSQSGWNPNGGDLDKNLRFGTFNRYANSWYSTSNVPAVKNTGEIPNIACPNETDRFSVSSSVAHLNYPVGLITIDEVILAGEGGKWLGTNTHYLNTNDYYWSLSPEISNSDALEFHFSSYGGTSGSNVYRDDIGLRPVISLKLGTEFASGGDGTGTNPYVVKY